MQHLLIRMFIFMSTVSEIGPQEVLDFNTEKTILHRITEKTCLPKLIKPFYLL